MNAFTDTVHIWCSGITCNKIRCPWPKDTSPRLLRSSSKNFGFVGKLTLSGTIIVFQCRPANEWHRPYMDLKLVLIGRRQSSSSIVGDRSFTEEKNLLSIWNYFPLQGPVILIVLKNYKRLVVCNKNPTDLIHHYTCQLHILYAFKSFSSTEKNVKFS